MKFLPVAVNVSVFDMKSEKLKLLRFKTLKPSFQRLLCCTAHSDSLFFDASALPLDCFQLFHRLFAAFEGER